MKKWLVIFIAFYFSACFKGEEFEAMGVFESDEVLISSQISGEILSFDVKEGDDLKEGQILAKIDDTQLYLQKDELESQILALKAKKYDLKTQLAPLEEKIAHAKKEQDRLSKLYSQKATTKQRLDAINSTFDYLQKDYDAKHLTMSLHNENLDLQIKALDARLKIIEDNIKKSQILSPMSAKVLEKYAFKGELASANRPLLKIANLDELKLRAYFIDTSLNRLKLGDKVSVLADFGKEYREYEGVISWISKSAEFTPKNIMSKDERKNLVYAVKIDVKNDGFLRLGAYAEVRLKDALLR